MVIVGQLATHFVTPFSVTDLVPAGHVQAVCEVDPTGLTEPAGQFAHCEAPPVPNVFAPHCWHVPVASRPKPGLHDAALQVVFVAESGSIAAVPAGFVQVHALILVELAILVEPVGQRVHCDAPPGPYVLSAHCWHVPIADRPKPAEQDDALQVMFVVESGCIAVAPGLFGQIHDDIAVEPIGLVVPVGQAVQDVVPPKL